MLTAADMDIWTVPITVVKPSGQTVTTSIAYVNDTALVLAIAANSIYAVDAWIQYNATTGGDIKFAWTIPAGAGGWWGTLNNPAAGGGLQGGGAFAWTDSYNAQGFGTGTPQCIRMTGIFTTAGTAGNLQFRWTQNTSSGTTTVMANSALIAQQIG